jgi:hypothetical protein
VRLKLDGMGRYTTPGVLTAYLDGAEVLDRDVDFEAAFIRERGAEVVAAFRRDGEAKQTIAEIGRVRMERVHEELRKGFEGA